MAASYFFLRRHLLAAQICRELMGLRFAQWSEVISLGFVS